MSLAPILAHTDVDHEGRGVTRHLASLRVLITMLSGRLAGARTAPP